MTTQLNVLIATNSEDSAEPVVSSLQRIGKQPAYDIVGDLERMRSALREEAWDIVMVDSECSVFPWTDYQRVLHEEEFDLPLLVMAESTDVETDAARTVQALENGASDYVLKNDWNLAHAFARVLKASLERKKLSSIEIELRMAEKRYRGMIENAVNGMFQWTPWGSFIGANPAMARIMGCENPAELVKSLKNREHEIFEEPGDRDRLLLFIREQGRVTDFETRVIRKDGRRIWISISAGAVRGDQQEITAIEGAVEDVTRRKAVESMIIRAKKEWESTFDCVGDCIVILDRELKIKRMNMALAKRLGIHPREAVGKAFEDVFEPDQQEHTLTPVIRSMADGGEHTDEISIPILGGDYLITMSPFFFEDHERAGTVLTARDVSLRKNLEAKLRQSQKMEAIGTLAGGIAHDFNNILGVIMGYTEMSLDKAEGDEALQERLERVLAAGNRATDLIRQILTFSRQEETNLSPLNLGMAVKEIIKMLKASLPKNIHFEEKLTETPDTINANLTQIHQVLMNLCTNAYHAMGEAGGVLTVEMDDVVLEPKKAAEADNLSPGRYLRLKVSDTGSGIDPTIIDNIFDPFFTTKKPGEGTGMGLAMVHGIVKSHGGAVFVSSALGKGSVFTVLLPEAVREKRYVAQGKEAPPTAGKGRVLFVDDEEDLAGIGKEMMESMGFEAVSTTNPLEALELFLDDPDGWDLVITDQSMPEMTGFQLAGKMLEVRPELPIIMCTGYSETLSPEKAKAGGVSAFLFKPVMKKDIAESIRNIFSDREVTA